MNEHFEQHPAEINSNEAMSFSFFLIQFLSTNNLPSAPIQQFHHSIVFFPFIRQSVSYSHLSKPLISKLSSPYHQSYADRKTETLSSPFIHTALHASQCAKINLAIKVRLISHSLRIISIPPPIIIPILSEN